MNLGCEMLNHCQSEYLSFDYFNEHVVLRQYNHVDLHVVHLHSYFKAMLINDNLKMNEKQLRQASLSLTEQLHES